MSEERNVQDFCSDDDVIPNGTPEAVSEETENETAEAFDGGGTQYEQPETEQARSERSVPIPPKFNYDFPNGKLMEQPAPQESGRMFRRRRRKEEQQTEKVFEPAAAENSVSDGAGTMNEDSRTAFEELKAQNEALVAQNAALKEQLDGINERLDRMTAQMANTNRAVAMHETIEGNLNKELQSYKNDFYGKLATPFLMQLISLYAEMKKELDDLKAEIAENEGPTGHEDVVSSLSYYLDKISGSLVNSGVETETPEVGDKIDPLKQSIVRTVPSDDPAMNGVIQSVRSDSYIYNNKVLLRAKVAVYKSK